MSFEHGKYDRHMLKEYIWLYEWRDHPKNPLIAISSLRERDWVADPTVVLPSESPDGSWHLFCSGRGIKHFTSNNGVEWTYRGLVLERGYSPFIYHEKRLYWLFYQVTIKGETFIVCRSSEDLEEWSKEITILTGERDWELGIRGEPYVRNPCIIKVGKEYWLYYSAGYIVLPDTGYEEPKYIGLAYARDLLGPYEKLPRPIITPNLKDEWRNLGAGAIKVYRFRDVFLGFNNGIYWGEDLHSHSAIHILLSKDGVNWFDSPLNPVISPTGSGWKKSFVYQLDVKLIDGELWMYYNARDDWVSGIERIGLAICSLPKI